MRQYFCEFRESLAHHKNIVEAELYLYQMVSELCCIFPTSSIAAANQEVLKVLPAMSASVS